MKKRVQQLGSHLEKRNAKEKTLQEKFVNNTYFDKVTRINKNVISIIKVPTLIRNDKVYIKNIRTSYFDRGWHKKHLNLRRKMLQKKTIQVNIQNFNSEQQRKNN